MAQTFLNSGTQASNFEDLIDIVTTISYEETPVFSTLGRTKASSPTLHKWTTQTLADGAENSVAEGASTTFAAADVTVQAQVTNALQIIKKKFSVSGSQDVAPNPGGNSYERQKKLKTIELAKDIDYNIINETYQAKDGDAGTAGKMRGIIQAITLEKAAGNNLLTENLYTQMSTLVYKTSGVKTDHIYCSGGNKLTINSWTQPSARHDMKSDTYKNTFSAYEGAWGTQAVVPDIHIPDTTVFSLKVALWKVAYYRPLEHKEFSVAGDYRGGHMLAELTLEYLNPLAGGKVTGLVVEA